MFSFNELYGCVLAEGFEGILEVDDFRGYAHNEPPRPPTHTEDGVPIRKLYVTNLPSNVTHHDLTSTFGRYGEVQHCTFRPHAGRWANAATSEVSFADPAAGRGFYLQTQAPSSQNPGYAFVTFARTQDAHRALCAGLSGNVVMRGRHLVVRPADTWHQPKLTVDIPVHPEPGTPKVQDEQEAQEVNDNELTFTILDVLDRDCLQMILEYLSLPDLIRSERVSKSWQVAVKECLLSRRRLATTRWARPPTTAALRAALIRVGDGLRELRIDAEPARTLNGRTFKTVARFCPRLELLAARGALESGGAADKAALTALGRLRSLSLADCPKLDDSALLPLLLRARCPLSELSLESAMHVSGSCLIGGDWQSPLALEHLSLSTMHGLRGSFLSAAAPRLAALTELRLDLLPPSCWRNLPAALKNLPSPSQLEDLSLLRCTSGDESLSHELAKALNGCTGLKRLRLWYNQLIRDATIEGVSRAVPELQLLEVCGCRLVTAAGLVEALPRLENLQHLNISRMSGSPTYAGGSVLSTVATLPALHTLRLQDCLLITSEELCELVRSSSILRELDVRGTMAADERLLEAAMSRGESVTVRELALLRLRVARTHLSPEASPPPAALQRAQLYLDWQDDGCDTVASLGAPDSDIFYSEDDDDDDSDGYSDDNRFMDEISDMFSESDSVIDFNIEDILWVQNVELDIFPGYPF